MRYIKQIVRNFETGEFIEYRFNAVDDEPVKVTSKLSEAEQRNRSVERFVTRYREQREAHFERLARNQLRWLGLRRD